MEIKPIEAFREFSNERFTKKNIYQNDGHTVFVLNFNPGQELPPHRHPGAALYLLVLEGSGTVAVNGSESEVKANDTVHVPGDDLFSFRNTGTGQASLYVVLAKKVL